MTKLVEFSKAMSPYVKGEQRAVSDELATKLEAEGAAQIVPSVFDRQTALDLSQKRRTYMTRGKK